MHFVHLSMVVNSCNAFPDIYLVAENRVVKITFLDIGTSEPAAEVFFSQVPGEEVEIVGLSVSTLSSSVFINMKNRGLFAYTTRGQLLWSAGPVLYRLGFRQGCRKNVTDCFFTSVPMVDQCEASIYVRSSHPFPSFFSHILAITIRYTISLRLWLKW